MDDFLHNLRSGKLKQPDRSSRSFNDPNYKGPPRRNAMDRRKRESDAKESFERLNAIKEVLESLSETQKRIAQAYEARTNAELRKARAMEVLAKNLYRMLNPEATDYDRLFDHAEAGSVAESNPISADTVTAAEPATAAEKTDTRDNKASAGSDDIEEAPKAGASKSGRLTAQQRQTIFEVTRTMRESGESWENIARHIGGKGLPTVSGKGTWRGVMVKTLYEKMTSKT